MLVLPWATLDAGAASTVFVGAAGTADASIVAFPEAGSVDMVSTRCVPLWVTLELPSSNTVGEFGSKVAAFAPPWLVGPACSEFAPDWVPSYWTLTAAGGGKTVMLGLGSKSFVWEFCPG